MAEGSLGLIVEGLVCLLLLATIFYCIIVNRKLEKLRSEQKGMHSFIRELSVATQNADKAIQGLGNTVQESGAELAGQIDKARNMSRLIKGNIETAQETINRLVVLTGNAPDVGRGQGHGITDQADTGNGVAVEELRRSMIGFDDLEPADPSDYIADEGGNIR